MATTYTKILMHVTFSTKHRTPTIPAALEQDLYTYIGGICRNLDSPLLAINGVADHVHLLVNLSKTLTLAELLMNVKRDSSHWINKAEAGPGGFGWQSGYFGFSIGQSAVEDLKAYIANQKEHHKALDFKDEMRTFLRKYGIEWDERYTWD
ncbi:MAG: IS200/IS605 family transposase [Planctomycetes bacterium]|nr:IS200/IS605 family transposase [Planctomycetota bacterium]